MQTEETFHDLFMEELTLQKSPAELTRSKHCSLLKGILKRLPSVLTIQREAKCNFVSYLT